MRRTLGEGGILAVAPTVANALHAATGKRLSAVPLTHALVWQSFHKREQPGNKDVKE